MYSLYCFCPVSCLLRKWRAESEYLYLVHSRLQNKAARLCFLNESVLLSLAGIHSKILFSSKAPAAPLDPHLLLLFFPRLFLFPPFLSPPLLPSSYPLGKNKGDNSLQAFPVVCLPVGQEKYSENESHIGQPVDFLQYIQDRNDRSV